MNIIILGAGRVGESVAESLVSEKNDITVIDTSPQRLADLQDRLDLRGAGPRPFLTKFARSPHGFPRISLDDRPRVVSARNWRPVASENR